MELIVTLSIQRICGFRHLKSMKSFKHGFWSGHIVNYNCVHDTLLSGNIRTSQRHLTTVYDVYKPV